MESEIVKKVFLNRIEDSYVRQQQKSKNEANDSAAIEKSNLTGSTDETFKNKFLDLVNSLLSNGVSSNTVSSDKEKIKTKPIKELNILKSRRVKKYDNENILSSSVFEMEELEELDSNEHFLSDEDASNEEETTTTTGLEDNNGSMLENIKKNVLKKRNSNVEEDLNNQMEKSGNYPIVSNKKYNNKEYLMSSKYSCSLPRDIPVMHHSGRMSTIKNIVNQSSEEENRADNENQYFNSNEKVEHQKRHKSRVNMTVNRPIQSMSTSYKHQNDDESESSPTNNNDLYEGDDELFEDDHNNNLTKTDRLDDDEDGDETKDMGQAISNLASSIVLKDGRELFGGVPSRRVPINSISKSCFE